MYGMVLNARGAPLVLQQLPDPAPGPGEVRVKVSACGVCRTDLHVLDGDLPDIPYPIIPGHEVVGRIDALGAGVDGLEPGMRVGVPWLGYTCGECFYCRADQENLCDRPKFTGYTRNGGFASHLVADARYCFPLGEHGDDAAIAPLLCAGLIGWRSLAMAGEGPRFGDLRLRSGRPYRGAGCESPGPVNLRLYPSRRSGGAAAGAFARRGLGRRF